MTAIQSHATHGGWRRVSHRPRRGNHLIQRALAAVRDWRRRLQDRNRSSTLDERTLLDGEICRGDTFYPRQHAKGARRVASYVALPTLLNRVPHHRGGSGDDARAMCSARSSA